MVSSKVIQPKKLTWEPHPQLEKARVAHLLNQRDDGAELSCMLVSLPRNTEVERHRHEEADDIIYVLEGKGMIWVEGAGDFPLEPGSFVRIPKGVMHQPHHIEADMLAYDVFYPALI